MKKYKKYELVITTSIVTIGIFIMFMLYLITNKYNEYTVVNANYVIDEFIEIVVNTKSLRKLEKNKYLYINNKKRKVKIIDITKNILKKESEEYHQVLLKVKNVSNKTNLKVSILDKKARLIKLIIDAWKEE